MIYTWFLENISALALSEVQATRASLPLFRLFELFLSSTSPFSFLSFSLSLYLHLPTATNDPFEESFRRVYLSDLGRWVGGSDACAELCLYQSFYMLSIGSEMERDVVVFFNFSQCHFFVCLWCLLI